MPPPPPLVRPRVKSDKTSYQSYYHIIMHKRATKITATNNCKAPGHNLVNFEMMSVFCALYSPFLFAGIWLG